MYYLLDITAVPAPEGDLTVLVSRLGLAVHEGVKNSKDTKLIHMYQVVGENRLLAVLCGDVNTVRKQVNEAAEGDVKLCCTPLRTIESFAKSLDIPESTISGGQKLSNKPYKFFIDTSLSYDGESSEKFKEVWKKEVEDLFVKRKTYPEDLDLYKAVMQKKMIVFAATDDVEMFDDLFWVLPLVVGFKGDKINFDEVKALEEFQQEKDEEEEDAAAAEEAAEGAAEAAEDAGW